MSEEFDKEDEEYEKLNIEEIELLIEKLNRAHEERLLEKIREAAANDAAQTNPDGIFELLEDSEGAFESAENEEENFPDIKTQEIELPVTIEQPEIIEQPDDENDSEEVLESGNNESMPKTILRIIAAIVCGIYGLVGIIISLVVIARDNAIGGIISLTGAAVFFLLSYYSVKPLIKRKK